MYPVLLSIHSLFRWLVLASLLYALYRAYKGWFSGAVFSGFDNAVRHYTATIAQVQLVLGLCLYFINPIIDYFLHHYSVAVHQRQIRFFGMEHSLMMFIAIIVITITSMVARRRKADKQKFSTIALGYTLGLLIILTSVPWPFSPMVSRPYFRPF